MSKKVYSEEYLKELEWKSLISDFEDWFPEMYVVGFDPDFMLRYRDDEQSQTVFISKQFMKTLLSKMEMD